MQLEDLLRLQEDLQEQHMGGSPRLMSDQDKMLFLSHMKTALDCEIVEALDETGWKPWASADFLNQDRYLSEMVDALHFFLNLILVAGDENDGPKELAEFMENAYIAKRRKNAQRQIDGYDGVTGKCKYCHSDIEEAKDAQVASGNQPYEGNDFCSQVCEEWFNNPVKAPREAGQ